MIEKILQDRLLKHAKINCIWNNQLDEIYGEDNPPNVQGVKLKSTLDDSITDLKVDGVFIAIGHDPATQIFKGKVEMDDEGYIITKPDSTVTSVEGVYAAGDVKDKTCIIVDDIIDSGGTIINAAKALKARGAKEVYVYITHGVLSGDAVKKIKSSVIKNLVITDTIDNSQKTKNVKNIEVLPISGLMGEAIKRISNSTSVSDLFK